MMHFSPLSPQTIVRIARGAVSLEQNYHYHSHGWGNHYQVRVAYPNGYGASIVCFEPEGDETDIWEVGLLQDGKLWSDDEGYDCIWPDLSEEDVVRICDHIYFM